MLITGRLKLIRKHDCDFWNLTYYRVSFNRFFRYYKFSLIHKIKTQTDKREHFLNSRGRLIINSVQKWFNPFLNQRQTQYLNLRRNLNFRKLFLNRNLYYVTKIYKRCYYLKSVFANDLLLGVKTPFQLYKPFKRKLFEKTKLFFRQITLFYNNFDRIKLKRFGRLGRKGQFGGVNYFLLLLESRVDSIVLRLNLGAKFIMRELIRAKKILIDGVPITYLNYVVKKHQFITFDTSIQNLVVETWKKRIPMKMFFTQPPYYYEINYRTLIIMIVPRLMDPSFVPFPFIRAKSTLVSGLHTVLWGW